jgi:hypothetical protein
VSSAQPGELRFGVAALREFLWESRKLQDRLDKLVAESSVEKLAVDSYRLSNWSNLAGMK